MGEKYKYKCKISGKRTFGSHHEAKEMMIVFTTRIRSKYHGKRIKHRQRKPEAKRVYLCPFCHGYHITKAVYFRENHVEIAKRLAEAKERRFDKLVNRRLTKEHWEQIKFDFELTGNSRLEVSNLGRVRSFYKESEGRILKGALVRGYRIIRLKLYKPRSTETQKKFKALKKEITNLKRKIAKEHYSESVEKRLKEVSEKLAENLKELTINHYFLVHAMVAKYFLPEPKAEETVLTHLDFDRLNNRASNLKWMTPEQNKKHKSNPVPY